MIRVTILCQSRLFFPLMLVVFLSISLFGNHPLSIEAIFPTCGASYGHTYGSSSNHPLSIEAIFPTCRKVLGSWRCDRVTILCQSRLFFPLAVRSTGTGSLHRNHPLSIEAIFPTSLGLATKPTVIGNHPLSIEAIFPTFTLTPFGGAGPFVTILCQSRLFFPQY